MLNQLNFKVKGREYVIEIPTAGKYYDIEATKQILGKGFYNSIVGSPLQSASNAQEMIDIESNLSILSPKIVEDLKVPFRDLGIADYLELKKAYDEQFVPWWESVLKLFNPQSSKVD
jgi:hypothetical protein